MASNLARRADLVSEMHALVWEEAPLREVASPVTDMLGDGRSVTHGPWTTAECQSVLIPWHEAGWIEHGGSRITGVVWSPHYGTGTSYRWTSWSAYDGNNWDHNSVNEVQWTVSGTSGYYYFWAHSICSHTTDKLTYRYDWDSSLPGNPTGTGWVS